MSRRYSRPELDETPFQQDRSAQRAKRLSLLLEASIDPNVRVTPLELLPSEMSAQLAEQLAERLALNVPTSAIEMAAGSSSHPIVIETLLLHGAYPTDDSQQRARQMQYELRMAGDDRDDNNDASDGSDDSDGRRRHSHGTYILELLSDARQAYSLVGQRARLRGLTDSPQRNGQLGRLVKGWPGFKRRAVRLDGSQSGRPLSVKEANLEMVDEDAVVGTEGEDGAVATVEEGASSVGGAAADGALERGGLVALIKGLLKNGLGSASADGDGRSGDGADALELTDMLNDGRGDEAPGSGDTGSSGGRSGLSSRSKERVFLAAARGDASVLSTLLRAGASPNAVSADGESLLRTAMTKMDTTGGVQCVEALLEAKANPNRSGDRTSDVAPLVVAVSTGCHVIVKLLLEAGARSDGTADDGPDRLKPGSSPTLDGRPKPKPPTAPLVTATQCLCMVTASAPDTTVPKSWWACFMLLLPKADELIKLTCLNEAAVHNNAAGVRVIQALIEDGVNPDQTIVTQLSNGVSSSMLLTPLMNACRTKATRCVQVWTHPPNAL